MATIPVDSRLNSKTAEFFSRQHRMFIDGRFVLAASGKTFPVYNPATGEVVAQVPEAEAEDVDRAVIAARRAFDDGPWTRRCPPPSAASCSGSWPTCCRRTWRSSPRLNRSTTASPFPSRGSPMSLSPSTCSATWRAGQPRSTGIHAFRSPHPERFHSYTLREPIGVVGQIIPWNFPLLMAAWKLAPALAAGCTVVLKLAEQTPMSGLRLAELFDQAGFPPGVVNVLTGYGEGAGAPLAAHPLVDKIAFTGSTEVGKLIVKASAGNLKKVTLELGGKSPAIVFPDADLDRAIAGHSQRHLLQPGTMLLRRFPALRAREASMTRLSRGERHRRRTLTWALASTRKPRWDRWSATSNSTKSPAISTPASRRGRRSLPAVNAMATAAISFSPPYSPTPTRT